MKKWIVTSLVCLVTLLLGGTQTQAATEGESVPDAILGEEIYSIEEPTWLFKAGTSKGKYHDRQDLGVILEPNTTIKIRQENPNFKGDVTLRLLTNDSKTEKSSKIGTEWVSVKTDASAVPFIETPYGENNATVEYEITGKFKMLSVFNQKTTEKEFFEEWDAEDGEFALIQSKSFQLFIPKLDKEAVRQLKDFTSINELVTYYEEIFTHYNKMLGLDPKDTETDKLNQNRYFMKADKNGAGGAYYSSNWTASTSNSVSMWLKKNSWGALHEIGHGYQAGFDGKGMYTGEVSNNLYAADFQYSQYGKEADKKGWMFEGGKEIVERNLYQAMIKDGKSYSSTENHRFRLILLAMMKQKAGNDAFIKMNQEYRRLASEADFKSANYKLPDLMNKYYGEVSGYDFTPVFNKWQVATEETQAMENRKKEYQATASLADIVPESQLVAARALVDPEILINSNFEMVDNQDIAPLGLKGTVHLTIDIPDIAELKNQSLLIKEGSKIVKEIKLNSKEITIESIPNGVYTMIFQNSEQQKYQMDQPYLFVKENQNELTIKFNKYREIKTSNLVNQSIQFLGLNDRKFAELSTNLREQQAALTMLSANPHSYYSGKKYVAIKVRDTKDQVVYTKEIQGTKASVGTEIIPFKIGYKLSIFHDETKNRLKSNEEILDLSKKENNFTMTQYGLDNKQLDYNPENRFKDKVFDILEEITKEEDSNGDVVVNEELLLKMKDDLWFAMYSFSEPNRTYFLNAYKDFLK